MNLRYRELTADDWERGTLIPLLNECGIHHAPLEKTRKLRNELSRLWHWRMQVTYFAEDADDRTPAGCLTALREVTPYSGKYTLYITDMHIAPQFRDTHKTVARGLLNCVVQQGIVEMAEDIYAFVAPEYETLLRAMLYVDPPTKTLCRKTPWGDMMRGESDAR